MRPPRHNTRTSSDAARSWFGANMTPNVERTTSKVASGKGKASASAWRTSSVSPSATARRVRSLEERADIIGSSDHGPAAGGRERRVAVAGGDVEHAFAGADLDGLAQRFADDLQRGADHGVVTRRPHVSLTRLDRLVVDGVRDCRHGFLISGFPYFRRARRSRGGHERRAGPARRINWAERRTRARCRRGHGNPDPTRRPRP